MTRVIIDLDPEQPDAPGFSSETSDLVFFLSWAFSARYGANHELSLASLVLKSEFKIDLTPLLTFADRQVMDEEDTNLLEEAWQEPSALAACCEQVVQALDSEQARLVAIREEYPELRRNIDDLGKIAAWAHDRDCRIRLTYELEALV